MKRITWVGQWIRDAWAVAALCVRLLVSKRWIWLFFAASGLLYLLLLSGLTEAAEEESRIPLAVVNKAGMDKKEEDREAAELLARLKEQSVLKIWETEEENGLCALRQGEVAAVLVIEKGYEKWLQEDAHPKESGSYGIWRPLTLHYLEGRKEQKILAELIAGSVLERYCFYRSYTLYQEQEELPSIRLKEYQETAEQYQKEAETGAFLEIHYETNALRRELIYLQVVLGMLAGILLLLALLLYAGGGEPGAPDRSGTALIGRVAALAGNFLYVFLLEMAAGSLLVTVFFWKASRYQAGDGANIGRILPAAVGYLFFFALAVSLLFLLLREVAGARERFLPLGMGMFALLAVLALVRVAASFLPEAAETMIRCSPGGWFVDRMLSLLTGSRL
ncbi:MAG: hypothetical protein HFI40_06225 [Lachnospiraceae bacterium]|jgi:hypothetical protein|nr:hypothetical protein [Lachnospiraceae bacterium]